MKKMTEERIIQIAEQIDLAILAQEDNIDLLLELLVEVNRSWIELDLRESAMHWDRND